MLHQEYFPFSDVLEFDCQICRISYAFYSQPSVTSHRVINSVTPQKREMIKIGVAFLGSGIHEQFRRLDTISF